MEEKLNKLAKLYERIYRCLKCVNASDYGMIKDSKRVMRVMEKRALASKIFLVGQALGGQTQRVSGRPYIKVNGKISSSGQNLDTFLRLFGFTMNPFDSSSGYRYAYSSDIIQCYPGKNQSGHGDRKPETREIANCISQGFLLEEIELIEPRLLLLMGRESRDSFYRHILQVPFPASLSEHIEEVASKKRLPLFHLRNRDVYIAPMQHPSGANPHFYEMSQKHRFIELIKEVLR